jgi:predicted nucleotidyltransferase
MSPKIKPIIKNLDNFLSKNFVNRKYFATIYGSYAYGKQSKASDLDILVCAENISTRDIDRCVRHIKKIHKENKLFMDDEIRHEKKVLIDYDFLHRAVSGEGFLDLAKKQYLIPEIKKTPEYLNSELLLLRFFLGVLMHKHELISGSCVDFVKFKNVGRENLLRILANVKQIREIDLENLINKFIYHKEYTGDFYLGFEDKPHYREYLQESVEELMDMLEIENKVVKTNKRYSFTNDWLRGEK